MGTTSSSTARCRSAPDRSGRVCRGERLEIDPVIRVVPEGAELAAERRPEPSADRAVVAGDRRRRPSVVAERREPLDDPRVRRGGRGPRLVDAPRGLALDLPPIDLVRAERLELRDRSARARPDPRRRAPRARTPPTSRGDRRGPSATTRRRRDPTTRTRPDRSMRGARSCARGPHERCGSRRAWRARRRPCAEAYACRRQASAASNSGTRTSVSSATSSSSSPR